MAEDAEEVEGALGVQLLEQAVRTLRRAEAAQRLGLDQRAEQLGLGPVVLEEPVLGVGGDAVCLLLRVARSLP